MGFAFSVQGKLEVAIPGEQGLYAMGDTYGGYAGIVYDGASDARSWNQTGSHPVSSERKKPRGKRGQRCA